MFRRLTLAQLLVALLIATATETPAFTAAALSPTKYGVATLGIHPVGVEPQPSIYLLDGPGGFPQRTASVDLKQGQTAYLVLKNNSSEPIAVKLQFVDKEGRVLIQKDATVKPGKDESLAFGTNFGGGAQPLTVLGQFGAVDAKFIGLLRPAIRIVETASGKTVRLVGPESFADTNSLGEANGSWYVGGDSIRGFTSAALTFNGQFSEARVTARNEGNEPVVVWLRFVDKEGKVLAKRFMMVQPGADESLAYAPNFAGGVQPGEVRAQVGTTDAKFIGLLQPTLRLIEKGSGKTIQSIGLEGFKAFNPRAPLK